MNNDQSWYALPDLNLHNIGHPCAFFANAISYKNQVITGDWVNLDEDFFSVQANVAIAIGEQSIVPNRESFIVLDQYNTSSWEIPSRLELFNIISCMNMINRYGVAFILYCEHYGYAVDIMEKFNDLYCGYHESKQDFAESYLWNDQNMNSIKSLGLEHDWLDWKYISTNLFLYKFDALKSATGKVYVFKKPETR